jgi:hypothetical protein
LKLHEQSAAAAGVFSSSVLTILMVGSFVDTSDGALHTKLWIDPAEELVEYSHTGAAVDVTFSVKELKVSQQQSLVPSCCAVSIRTFFSFA